jgi:hypothetical protein
MATKKLQANEKQQLYALASELAMRSILASRLGQSYGGDRDIYAALGYPKILDYAQYEARYQRQDIAKAIIDAPAEDSWRDFPKVEEPTEESTDFELTWDKLAKEKKLANILPRLDRLASLGRYAVLLLGFDDKGEFSTEVTKASNLLYAMPYSESSAKAATYERDKTNPRYGLPVTYNISSKDAENKTSSMIVHWSRIIHVAEDCLENDVFGIPRLEAVYNRLQDLELISGGSAEMFWRGAFPGLGFTQDGLSADLTDVEKTAFKEQVENYVHNLQRYLSMKGVKIDQLAVQVADPTNHIAIQIDLISAAVRIPKRILLGSERGELASSQDERAWATRIDKRRKTYCGPLIIQPLIERLVSVGVLPLPKEKYDIKWPDPLAPSEKDKAEIGEIRARSLASYTNAIGADTFIPLEIFAEKFLGLSPQDITRIDDINKAFSKDELDDNPPDPGAPKQ